MASERWHQVAAPGDDLPAALAGSIRPELILKAVTELEAGIALLGEWLKEVNLGLIMRIQKDGATTAPSVRPSAIWTGPAVETVLKDNPTLSAANRKLAAIELEAKRLSDVVEASGRAPIAELRHFLDTVLDVEQGLHQLLSEAWNRLANIDPLTGLGNRPAMLRRLSIECDRHARSHQPCCVAILDLDRFKAINDTYGHAAGDVVLRSIAGLLATSIRPYDEVFRYGGDEFVLCLPNADLRTAWAVAERLRLRAAQWPVPTRGGETVSVTLSIGVAPLSASAGVEGSLDLADRALYHAKQSGRNTLAVCRD
jgi:diguanylate cyclase